jgi:hypothetical protein
MPRFDSYESMEFHCSFILKRAVPAEQAAKFWGKALTVGRTILELAHQRVHPSEIETVNRGLEQVRRNLANKFFGLLASMLILKPTILRRRYAHVYRRIVWIGDRALVVVLS